MKGHTKLYLTMMFLAILTMAGAMTVGASPEVDSWDGDDSLVWAQFYDVMVDGEEDLDCISENLMDDVPKEEYSSIDASTGIPVIIMPEEDNATELYDLDDPDVIIPEIQEADYSDFTNKEIQDESSIEETIYEEEVSQELALLANADGTITLTRMLQYGMWGEDVRDVQQRLYDLGYLEVAPDGSFGWYTWSAVNAFQAAMGLEYPDGMVGNWTIGKLNALVSGSNGSSNNQGSGSSSQSSGTAITLSRMLQYGMSGEDVRTVQQRLYDLGYLEYYPDGIFGWYTWAAVMAFQADMGLEYPDGMVGNWTVGKFNELAGVSSNSGNSGFNPTLSQGSSNTANGNAALDDEPAELSADDTMYMGMSGDNVLQLQKILYDLGYLMLEPDGNFGEYTKAAVKSFQRDNGVKNPSGVVDSWTIDKLNNNPYPSSAYTNAGEEPNLPSYSSIRLNRVLSLGMTGDDVKEIQQFLADYGYYRSIPNGIYDEETRDAVNEFQKTNGLDSPDGMVGNWTLGKMNGDPEEKGEDRSYEEIVDANGNLDLHRSLSIEMEGDDVAAVQDRLKELGYLSISSMGYYGNITASAVYNFQRLNGHPQPSGIVDAYTVALLNGDPVKAGGYHLSSTNLTISSLASSRYITDKNYDRLYNDIRYIIPHHMAGRLSGAACAQYFLGNGLENSANYCIGYDGDIAASVPEEYGAWTSSYGVADRQGITIEVSDSANDDWTIPEAAQESLVELMADLIRRYPTLGGEAVYDPNDEVRVLAARNGSGSWSEIKGNVLFHRWTSGGTTSCPEWHMIQIMSSLCDRVNALLK